MPLSPFSGIVVVNDVEEAVGVIVVSFIFACRSLKKMANNGTYSKLKIRESSEWQEGHYPLWNETEKRYIRAMPGRRAEVLVKQENYYLVM